jgi:uncharacterized repeat protein (TIGR03843 family)
MALYQGFDAQRVTDGPHDVGPADEDALRFVREATIGDGWLHPRSSNYTFVVELTLGEQHGFGVYKPAQGEAPLWDFPSGTLYKRECASYDLASLLGWGLVPPTVVREGEAGVGSLQLFVAADDDSNFFTLRESHRDALFQMAVFDLIANNADRKGGHCLAGPEGALWGVDNGLTFHEQRKLRTVIWDFAGEAIPETLLADVRVLAERLCGDDDGTPSAPSSPSASSSPSALARLIDGRELEALRRRVRLLVEQPTMPEPQSRHDVPWPLL